MQVKTAAAACAVQRFAHKVKARTALELEVLIHLPQGQPAAGGLGLLPAAGGQPLKAPVLGGVGQLLPLCGGEHGRRVAVLQPGGRPHSTAQLLVQQAQPEVSGAAPCRLGGVGRKQAGKCGFVHCREEVQLHSRSLGAAARGQQAGQLHDADAGKAVVGELHLAVLAGKHTGTVQQGCCCLGADAGQSLVGLCALQGGQAGVQRLHPAAALGGEPGAKAVGAELRPCLAAHGADDGIGAQRFGRALCRLELHGVAAAALAQGAHGAAGAQLHMVLRKVVLQQGQHVRRLIGVRIHPARLVGAGIKPQRMEPAQRVGGIYGIQQRTKCCRVGSEIQLRCNAGVIQIATAIAGGKQLFARLRVALQHNDMCSGGTLCRRQRGCKTGGTAAQNEDVRHPDTCLSQ